MTTREEGPPQAGSHVGASDGEPSPLLPAGSKTSNLQSQSMGNDNPWITSPAVTITQSELSIGSGLGTAISHVATAPSTMAPAPGPASPLESAAATTSMQEEQAKHNNPSATVEDVATNSASLSLPQVNAALSNTASLPPQPPLTPTFQEQQASTLPPSSSAPVSSSSPTVGTLLQEPAQTQTQPTPSIVGDAIQISHSNNAQVTATPTSNNAQNSLSNPNHLTVDTTSSALDTQNLSSGEQQQPPNQLFQQDSHSNSNNNKPEEDVEDGSYQEGGRLWQAALREAEKEKTTTDTTKPRSRFAESIMERTRSRADPNALVSPTSNGPGGKPSMVSLGDNEGSFILSTALAKKRVRVVQLLLIGLVGLLLGLLGNFFVSTSCHFATVNIMVGQNEKTFEFHFGLWKYSPIESVFQGYPYCYKYDQNYSNEAPIVARVANIVALVFGLVSISILWLYLIFGSTDKLRWKWAVRIAVIAGLVQLITLYFFFGNICQEYQCEFGPGAYLSVFTSVVWFVLACEMHYHMPVAIYASSGFSSSHNNNNNIMTALEEPRSLVTTMEMTHIDEVTREYITRVTGKTKEDEMPALNMDLKRVRPKSNLYSPTNACGLYIPSPRGTYQAPDPSLVEEAMNGGVGTTTLGHK